MKATIREIKKEWGQQPKKSGGTFGPAMGVEAEIDNGELAFLWLWEEKAIGEEVEVEKRGEYWNIVSRKDQKTAEQHDDVMKGITTILNFLEDISGDLKSLVDISADLEQETAKIASKPLTGYEKARKVADDLKGEPLPPEPEDIDDYQDYPEA